MDTYLSPRRFLDSDHPAVVEFGKKHRGTHKDLSDQAVGFYSAVREAIRRNLYTFNRVPQTLSAMEKCHPHLFDEQMPSLPGDMPRDSSRA